jgi:hypothetical protein
VIAHRTLQNNCREMLGIDSGSGALVPTQWSTCISLLVAHSVR